MTKRELINRWVRVERAKVYERFPDNPSAINATLVGILQDKLEDIAMGGTASEIAFELIEEAVNGAA
jgi:hypothetical protein